jgi:hypothetical protein
MAGIAVYSIFADMILCGDKPPNELVCAAYPVSTLGLQGDGSSRVIILTPR